MTTERTGLSRRGRNTVLLTVLAAAVLAVLLHGAAQRNASGPGAATPASAPEPSAPGLRADLEKTPLSYFSDYWLQLASTVKPRLLLVGSRKIPALVVGPDLAVSTIDAADPPRGEMSEEASTAPSPRLLAADATVGLALFEIAPPSADGSFRAAERTSLHPGMLVAAISVDAQNRLEVMPGHLLSAPAASIAASADSLDVFVPLTPSIGAAAIVDLDANLVGAIFRHAEKIRVLSVDSLLKAVTRLRAHPTCRSIEAADLEEAVRRMAGVEGGVVVERVAPEAFRPEGSLRAGDMLLEWNGHEVTNPREFEALYDAQRPGAVVSYLLRRGPRSVRGRTLMPGSDCRPLEERPVVLPTTGLTLAWDSAATDGQATSAGWHVVMVKPGSPAQASGIQPDDRILSADDSRLDRESVLRALGPIEKRGKPILLTLQRGDRVKLVALRPGGR